MRILLFIFCCLSLLACGNGTQTDTIQTDDTEDAAPPPETDAQVIYTRSMETHDAVMPKYMSISKAGIELGKYLREQNPPKEVSSKIVAANRNMDLANDAMMEWMGKLNQSPEKMKEEGKSDEEVLAYWQRMDQEMQLVKKSMNESLAEGQSLLKELGLPVPE